MDQDRAVQPETRWLLGLGAAGIALMLVGLVLPLTDGDSASSAFVARSALRSGEWLVFYFGNGRVFDKPPLTIWLLQLSMAAFGGSEWALRLWHVLMGLATIATAYFLARLAHPLRPSLVAALVLLLSWQFFYQTLVPEQDIPLTLFITLAMYWNLRWERDGRLWMAALAGACTALAVLSKGLIGVVLPVLIVAVHLVLDRPKWPRAWPRDVAAAIVAFLIVAAPWFVVAGLRQGRAFVDTFFLGSSLGIGRFFHAVLSHPSAIPAWAGILAYVVFLPLGMLPWTGWVWPGLRKGWQARAGGSTALRFCAVWVVTVLAFLTLSPGDKVIRYLLPAIPAMAVLAGSAAADPRWMRAAARVSIAIGGALGAALVWLAVQPLSEEAAPYRPLALAFLLPLAVGIVGGAILAFRGRSPHALAVIAALTLVAYAMLITGTIRQWDGISPWRPIAATVNAIGRQDARVLIEGERSPFAEYYIASPVEFVSHAALVSAWRTRPIVAIIPAGALASLPPLPSAVPVTSRGHLVVVKNFP
jgi:4-amino-4-deoxy-L-arabinose transferase-like glycosyltransferase